METQKLRKGNEPILCIPCGIRFNSNPQAQQHFNGKRHLKILRAIAQQRTNESILNKIAVASMSAPVDVPSTAIIAPVHLDNAATSLNADAKSTSILLMSDDEEQKVRSGNTSPPQVTSLAHQMVTGEASEDSIVASTQPSCSINREGPIGKGVKRKRVSVHCTVCNLILGSERTAGEHFAGTRHAKNVRLLKQSAGVNASAINDLVGESSMQRHYCHFCNFNLNSEFQTREHREGPIHKRNVEMRAASYREQTASVPQSSSEGTQCPNSAGDTCPGYHYGWYYCQACDISVPNVKTLQLHIRGDDHKEKTNTSLQNLRLSINKVDSELETVFKGGNRPLLTSNEIVAKSENS